MLPPVAAFAGKFLREARKGTLPGWGSERISVFPRKDGSVADLSMFANDLETQHYPSGHRFFSVGDPGHVMYVVTDGEVEISLRGRALETVQAGGIFGELALIDHKERSAEVDALTAVSVAVIDQEYFLDLVRTNPSFALEVMKVMSERLRHLDALL
jgi:CRP/FNR family cyclic AMP-dependent transcriptional regulator